jgi:hypothetical protein
MYWLVNAICDPADPYAGDLKKNLSMSRDLVKQQCHLETLESMQPQK